MAAEGFKRKLTAILSADVVGYSRLMEEADMTTVRNLREYQKVIAGLISQYRGRVVDSPVDSFKRAHELAQRALALDDKSPNVHILLGTIYLAQRLHDKAIAAGNHSIFLAPNMSIAHAHLASTMFFSGRFEDAIVLTEKAMRLSPWYPAFYLSPLARSFAFKGRFEEAIVTSNKLFDRSRIGDYPEEWALLHLAGLYVAVGRQDEARALMADALKINPGLSLMFFKQTQPFKRPADMQRELEALKKAGLQ